MRPIDADIAIKVLDGCKDECMKRTDITAEQKQALWTCYDVAKEAIRVSPTMGEDVLSYYVLHKGGWV